LNEDSNLKEPLDAGKGTTKGGESSVAGGEDNEKEEGIYAVRTQEKK